MGLEVTALKGLLRECGMSLSVGVGVQDWVWPRGRGLPPQWSDNRIEAIHRA